MAHAADANADADVDVTGATNNSWLGHACIVGRAWPGQADHCPASVSVSVFKLMTQNAKKDASPGG